jgi:hypothetical protein
VKRIAGRLRRLLCFHGIMDFEGYHEAGNYSIGRCRRCGRVFGFKQSGAETYVKL